LYASPWAGRTSAHEASNRFFILGLSPNKARLSIRFFHVLPLDALEQHIRQHFEDLAICRSPKDREILPLRRLIQELCLQHKLDNAPPNLEGAFFESIILGTPYPLSILQTLVRRIRAEQAGEYSSVSYPRAALLKGFLNRWYRYHKQSEKEFNVSLDESNEGIGYCLGRLFAVLEKIQEDASGIATIRERYYGSASSTPAVAFPQLLKLKNHHLAKIDARGKVIHFEKLLGQVMNNLQDSFPTHLSLFEQGAFSVGYYHQRQAFFQKKETVTLELQTAE
jgi:CRISPR-associated protein Csd1